MTEEQHLSGIQDIIQHGGYLEFAIHNSYMAIIKYLIECGEYEANCVLELAAKYGNKGVVQYLVSQDINSGKALIHAIEGAHYDIIRYLIESDFDIDYDNGAPLKVAAECGNVDIVHYLIANGAKTICYCEESALKIATEKGFLNIVQILIEHGACIYDNSEPHFNQLILGASLTIDRLMTYNKFIIHGSNNPLYFASKLGHLDIIHYLFNLDLYSDTEYENALILAVMMGHLNVVHYFLTEDICSEYILCYAAMVGHLNIVQYLVEEEEYNIHNFNNMALRIATRNGHLHIVKYLIDEGADIHANDDETLMIAFMGHRPNFVKYLVQQGANVHRSGNYIAQLIALNPIYRYMEPYLVELGG